MDSTVYGLCITPEGKMSKVAFEEEKLASGLADLIGEPYRLDLNNLIVMVIPKTFAAKEPVINKFGSALAVAAGQPDHTAFHGSCVLLGGDEATGRLRTLSDRDLDVIQELMKSRLARSINTG